MRKLVFLSLLIFSSLTFAEVLSWEPPTTRMDGTPLDPMTELSEYRLYCGDVVTSIKSITEGENTYQVKKHEILPDYGTFECYLTAVDVEGLESQPSNTVELTWTKTAPASPTNLLIIVDSM